jgi:hypothetical protein
VVFIYRFDLYLYLVTLTVYKESTKPWCNTVIKHSYTVVQCLPRDDNRNLSRNTANDTRAYINIITMPNIPTNNKDVPEITKLSIIY